MRFAPIFMPLAIFLLFFLIAAFRALRFLSRIRATVSDSPLGKGVHLETPFGTIDLKPQQGEDADLASIPKYPGAVPTVLTAKTYEADINIAGHAGRYLSASYTTDDPAGVVIDYYLREFPSWHQDRSFQNGYRLILEDSGCQRAITVHRFGKRTTIEYAIVHKENIVQAAAAGTTFASDSNFGVLR